MKPQLFLLCSILQSICSFNISEHIIYPPSETILRIAGGADAPKGLAPFQCSLQFNGSHACGCAVINAKFILTAGHCVGERPANFSIWAGSNKLNKGGKHYPVEEFIRHENFDKPNYAFDIAVVKVQNSIEFDENVKPIELNYEEVPDGAEVQLTGWGFLRAGGPSPQKLQFVKLVALQTEKCQQIVGKAVHESHICTTSPIGVGGCSGDSGGPLVYRKKLVGIVNFGLPCAMGQPDAYAKVSYYANWIKKHSSV